MERSDTKTTSGTLPEVTETALVEYDSGAMRNFVDTARVSRPASSSRNSRHGLSRAKSVPHELGAHESNQIDKRMQTLPPAAHHQMTSYHKQLMATRPWLQCLATMSMTHFENLPSKQQAELTARKAVPGTSTSLAGIPIRGHLEVPGTQSFGLGSQQLTQRSQAQLTGRSQQMTQRSQALTAMTGRSTRAGSKETTVSEDKVVHRAKKKQGVVAGLSVPSVKSVVSTSADEPTDTIPEEDDEVEEEAPKPKNQYGWQKRWTYDPDADAANRIVVKDPVKTHEAVVPAPVKALSYWSAMDIFRVYDQKNCGELNAKQFWQFLCAACRDKEEVSRQRSDELFGQIDVDGSGNIDKEEFLGWVFQTNNNYLSEVRKRLEGLQPTKVKKLFEEIDTNFNNQIDKDEFWIFVEKWEGTMSREASDELHAFIDADHSGEIDLDEFLNWVHPSRELQLLETGKDLDAKKTSYDAVKNDGAKSRGSLPSGFAAVDNGEGWEAPKKPLMEVQRGKPVILEFTAGDGFEFQFAAIRKDLKSLFGEQIKCEAYKDDYAVAACTYLEAKVGRGICLWDRATMVAYQEDPFVSVQSARNWIRNVLVKCLPDVLQAANLRHYKRMKMNICYECGKELGKRFLKHEEYKCCSATCRMAIKNRVPGKSGD